MRELTEEEQALYRRRLEEGFDLQHDARYNLWRKTIGKSYSNSSEGTRADHMSNGPPNILLNESHSTLRKFFPPSPPTFSKPPIYSKTSAKVLTSSECIRNIEEKERLKRENQERKAMQEQERRRKREIKEKARADRIARGWLARISLHIFYSSFALSQTTAQTLTTCLREDAKPGRKERQSWQLKLIRTSRRTGLSPLRCVE